MLRDFINIVGVDEARNFPVLTPLDRYKQFTAEELVTIPEVKPDMEQITTVMVEPTVTGYKVIATPTGVKVVVDVELLQKIIYTANEPTQPIHSAEFIRPFCNFIEVPLIIPANSNIMKQLQILGLTLEDVIVGPPQILLEDLSIKMIDARNVKKCGILFVWVALNPALTPLLPVTAI
ncbi:DUF3794 domain-containing protein [Clostridium sp.]|uniref:DUF3794 domain-containing protein n=1 Tax=Clostridium sp. TaxID=1506 RepID=UPI001A446A92|nr:DUF3794 domain-containing protein [Clostridium sp.]MBK5237092.1 DUF3794 domain-containing protein [Clostridium sp.]